MLMTSNMPLIIRRQTGVKPPSSIDASVSFIRRRRAERIAAIQASLLRCISFQYFAAVANVSIASIQPAMTYPQVQSVGTTTSAPSSASAIYPRRSNMASAASRLSSPILKTKSCWDLVNPTPLIRLNKSCGVKSRTYPSLPCCIIMKSAAPDTSMYDSDASASSQ